MPSPLPPSLGGRGGGGNGGDDVVVMGEGGGGSKVMAMEDSPRPAPPAFDTKRPGHSRALRGCMYMWLGMYMHLRQRKEELMMVRDKSFRAFFRFFRGLFT